VVGVASEPLGVVGVASELLVGVVASVPLLGVVALVSVYVVPLVPAYAAPLVVGTVQWVAAYPVDIPVA